MKVSNFTSNNNAHASMDSLLLKTGGRKPIKALKMICAMFVASLFFVQTSFGIDYYYRGTGNVNLAASWSPNANGVGGTSPSNFTANNQIFNLRNLTTITLNGSWTVSGTSSKIVVGDGTNACNFIVGSNFVLNGTVDVSAVGTLTLSTTGVITSITLGTLATTSTVDYASSALQSIRSATYGNLTVSGAKGSNNVTFAGSSPITINGNLTVSATGSGDFVFASTNADFVYNIGGDFVQSSFAIDLGSGGNGESTINLTGDFIQTGGTITTSGGNNNSTLNFNASGIQTIQYANTTNSVSFVNLVVSSTTTLQLSSSIQLYQSSSGTFVGRLTVNGTIIFPSTFTLVVGAGNTGASTIFTLASGATLVTANTSGVIGSIPTNAAMTRTLNAAANYEFNGTGAQVTSTAVTSATTIKVNNSAGVTASAAITSLTTLTIGDVTSNSVLNDGGFAITSTGTINLTSGTFNVGSAGTGTAFPAFATRNYTAGTTVAYISGVAQAVRTTSYPNLTFSGAGTKTPATGTTTVSGAWSTTGGTAALNTNNASITVTGNVAGSGNIVSGSGTIALAGSWTNSGTFTAGTGTVNYNATTGGQGVGALTYNNLTLSNTSGTQTANGAVTVNATLLTTAGGTLNMLGNQLLGTLATVTNGGTIQTQNTTSTPIPTGKTWGGTVEYNTTAGGQTVMAGTYNNLTLSNTSNTQTASGALTVSATFTTTSGGTLNMVSNQLLGTLATITNGGTIQTQNTTSTPIPTGKTWGGTVQYNTTAGGQTVMAGTYNNLTVSNTSNTQTASGALTVNATLTTTSGGILNMVANQLLGTLTTITNGGTIQTQNTTSTPIPTGKTWGGTVQYNTTAGGQTVMAGTYNNLTVSNTSNTQTASGALTVNGTLTTTSGGTLNMVANQLLGTLTTVTNGGTIQTQNTTSTPLPTGKTWGGTVQYNTTTGGQTVMAGTYNNLTLSNTSNTQTASGSVIVNATLATTAGGAFAIGTNTLTLNAAVTGTGTLTGSNTSNLEIGGTAGTLNFTAGGTNNFLKDFTLNTGATATLGNALNITGGASAGNEGTLTVTGTATLTASTFLTIKSNTFGTARIAPGRTTGGYITGNVSVERFVPQNSSKGWRLLASTTSGQTINDAWQESQANSMNNPNPGFGTKITAGNTITTNLTTARNAGFDTLSAGVSLFKYNATTDVLETVTATNTGNIANEQGYFIFIRGDRFPGQFGAGAPTTSTVLRSKGTLFLGDQNKAYTGTSNYGLVRNPYPSRIDMRFIQRGSSLIDAYQVWDAKLGGTFGVGGFQTFDKITTGPNTGSYRVIPGGGSYGVNGSVQNFIESGAAFYTQSTNHNGLDNWAQVTEACKTTSSSNNSYRPSGVLADDKSISFTLFALNPGSTDVVDGGLALFNDTYSNSVTVEDVRKSGNFSENFGMLRDNTDLVVEKRKDVTSKDSVFFKMYQLRQISYRLDFATLNFDPATTIFLQDKFTNTNTPIAIAAGTSYTFTVNATAGTFAQDRFRLVLATSPNTFTGTGNWTDNARWSKGTPPASGDIAVIAANANATLNTDFTVGGSLTMEATSTLVVNPTKTLTVSGTADFAGQSVTFKSDGTGYGSLGQVTGTLTGATNVTVERYIPNNGFRSWRLLSVPTYASGQTIRQAWQEGVLNPLPGQNNFANHGTQITGVFPTYAAATAAGFDSTSVQASMLTWNGTGWSNVTSTNNPIANNKAYFLFVRGERSKGVTGAVTNSSATTLRTNGTVYTGNQVFSVATNGFGIVANTYPSAISFTGLTRSNVGNLFYIWDSKKQNGNSLGVYQTFSGINSFNCLVGGGSYTLGQPNTTIESGQAFFVNGGSTAGGGTVTLLESAKISGSNGNLGFRPAAIPAKIDSRLYDANNDMLDANTVVFDVAYSKEVDADDAVKFGNPGANFAIETGSKILAIEGRQPVADHDMVQFRMWNLKQQTYKLEFSAANVNTQGLYAILEDSYLNTATEMDLKIVSSVSFEVNSNPGSSVANRFRIVFSKNKPVGVGIVPSYVIAPNPVEGNTANIVFKNQPAGNYNIKVVSSDGKLIMAKTINHTGGSRSQLLALPSGITPGSYQIEIIEPGKARATKQLIVKSK